MDVSITVPKTIDAIIWKFLTTSSDGPGANI